MNQMNNEKLNEIKDWVLVNHETNEAHHYETFDEALYSPYKGTIMTRHKYENEYKIKNSL